MLRTYRTAPAVPTGYPLFDEFSVIVPQLTTNLISNPSVERALTGYGATAGTVARTATKQRRGVYSILATPSAANSAGGVYYDIDLTAGTTYTFSIDLWGAAGVEYSLAATDPAISVTGILPGMWIGVRTIPTYSAAVVIPTNTIGLKRIRGKGCWQRHHLTFTSDVTDTRRLHVLKTATNNVGTFYTDGWQLEAKVYPTTYADGDLIGFLRDELAYYWTGAPHASTSVRAASTYSGGRTVSLRTLRFALFAFVGLGMAVVSNRDVALARGGSLYDSTVEENRGFSIVGRFDERNYQQVQALEKQLYGLVNPLKGAESQPIVMLYEPRDSCDKPLRCSPLEIKAVYSDGLEGLRDNLHSSAVQANFTAFADGEPAINESGNAAAELEYVTAINSTYGIIERYNAAEWRNLSASGATNGDILNAAYSNGALYVVGAFTTINGVAANYVAKWEDGVWTGLGSGLNNSAEAVVADGLGNVYVGGKFTTAGGGSANYVAKWTGTTWTALGAGTDFDVSAIALDGLGNVYVGGSFTAAGGGAASRIAKWNGSSWSALGTGVNGTVRAIVVAPDGVTVYAGGSFTTAGGNPAARIAKWSGSAWSALGLGIDGASVRDMAFGPDGYLYVVGNFAGPFNITSSGIAKWNGSGWSGFGTGLTNTFGTAITLDITIQSNGVVYVAGTFDTANGIPVLDGLARWTGSTWTPMDVDLPFTVPGPVYALQQGHPYKVVVTYDDTGTVQVSGLTTVTNNGTAATSPKARFWGPGRLVQLRNATTQKAIYFNITLSGGEYATLDLSSGSFVSNLRGNIASAILPGSNVTNWKLIEGDNLIETFITGGVGLDTKVTMEWRHGYLALSDGIE